MKLNTADRWLINNPVRALIQRFYEIPLLRRMGGKVENSRVLKVGCGRGVGLPLQLSQFGAAHVDGIDLELQQVTRAQMLQHSKYDGRIDLHVASVKQLTFRFPILTANPRCAIHVWQHR